jgi:DNA-binding PadR family transcriptional regulator
MMTPKIPAAAPFLPLSPAMFYVLVALADGEKHGYAVMKEVSLRTAGKVRLSAGTLYGIIKRLLAAGLIEESRRRPVAEEDDERRRYYRLSVLGRQVAVAEAERMDEALAVARVKKLLGRAQTA